MAVEPGILRRFNAGIAQLVERDLAKVEVAGSSPVFRSKFYVRWQRERLQLSGTMICLRLLNKLLSLESMEDIYQH